MSLYDYRMSIQISSEDHPFYALMMAAMRQADDFNLMKLRSIFPDLYEELKLRYHAPGGILETDPQYIRERTRAEDEEESLHKGE